MIFQKKRMIWNDILLKSFGCRRFEGRCESERSSPGNHSEEIHVSWTEGTATPASHTAEGQNVGAEGPNVGAEGHTAATDETED